MNYIIEIEDEPLVRKSALDGETAVYRAKGFKSLVFDENGLSKLTPYSGAEDFCNGLNAAWEAAHDLYWMNGKEIADALGTNEEYSEVLDMDPRFVVENMMAYRDRIKAADRLSVGDEVIPDDDDRPFLITRMDGDSVYGFDTHSQHVRCYKKSHVDKTGRHFDFLR